MTPALPPDDGGADEAVGLLEGRYQIGELIGRGGMAEVRRGIDLRLGREIAVKLLPQAPGADRDRFAAEARMLAHLSHPNLVRLFDAGGDGSIAWIVMELVEGTTMTDRCRNGPLTDREVTEAGRQLADALAYVHGKGVVHRDVKPSNILFDESRRCLLADFGVARLVDSASLTATGMTLGTPGYLAPEQVAGDAVGPPADIYSLGLVLAEALSGQRAFSGSPAEAAAVRLSKDPEFPSGLSPEWRLLLRSMTRRDPASRPSASEVTELLDERLGMTRPMGFVVPAVGGTEVARQQNTPTLVQSGAVDATEVPPQQNTPTLVPGGASTSPTGRLTSSDERPPASPRPVRPGLPLAAAVMIGVAAIGLGFLVAVLLGVGSRQSAAHPPSTTGTNPGSTSATTAPTSSTTSSTTSTTTTTTPKPLGVAGAAGSLVSVVESGVQNHDVAPNAAQDVLNSLAPLLSQSAQQTGGQVGQQLQQLAQVVGKDVQKGQILGSAVGQIEGSVRQLAKALGYSQPLDFSGHPHGP